MIGNCQHISCSLVINLVAFSSGLCNILDSKKKGNTTATLLHITTLTYELKGNTTATLLHITEREHHGYSSPHYDTYI
jgi:hypothetical protein